MLLNGFLQSETKQNLSLDQKVTGVTTISGTRIISLFGLSRLFCFPTFSCCSKKPIYSQFKYGSNSLFSVALFSSEIHRGKGKKLTNNYIWIKRFFKDVIYLFCSQGLKFIDFIKHFEILNIVGQCVCVCVCGGEGGGWGVALFLLLWRIAYENWYVILP